MSDVVDVLEALGADADLARAESADLEAMLQREGVEPACRTALLAGDAGALQALLRAPEIVCVLINPPREEEDEEEEEDGEQDEEHEEEGDDEKLEFSQGLQSRD